MLIYLTNLIIFGSKFLSRTTVKNITNVLGKPQAIDACEKSLANGSQDQLKLLNRKSNGGASPTKANTVQVSDSLDEEDEAGRPTGVSNSKKRARRAKQRQPEDDGLKAKSKNDSNEARRSKNTSKHAISEGKREDKKRRGKISGTFRQEDVERRIERLLPKLGKFTPVNENRSSIELTPIFKGTAESCSNSRLKGSHRNPSWQKSRGKSLYSLESCSIIGQTLRKILLDETSESGADCLFENGGSGYGSPLSGKRKGKSNDTAGELLSKMEDVKEKIRAHQNFISKSSTLIANRKTNSTADCRRAKLPSKADDARHKHSASKSCASLLNNKSKPCNMRRLPDKFEDVGKRKPNSSSVSSISTPAEKTSSASICRRVNSQVLHCPSATVLSSLQNAKANAPRGLHTIAHNKHVFSIPKGSSDMSIGNRTSARTKDITVVRKMIEERLKKYKKRKEESYAKQAQSVNSTRQDECDTTISLPLMPNIFTKEEREMLKSVLSEYINMATNRKVKTAEDEIKTIENLYENLSRKISRDVPNPENEHAERPLAPVLTFSKEITEDMKEREKLMEVNRKAFDDLENDVKFIKITENNRRQEETPLENAKAGTIKIDCELVLKTHQMEALLLNAAKIDNENKTISSQECAEKALFLPKTAATLSGGYAETALFLPKTATAPSNAEYAEKALFLPDRPAINFAESQAEKNRTIDSKLIALKSREKLTNAICNLIADQEKASQKTYAKDGDSKAALKKNVHVDVYLMDKSEDAFSKAKIIRKAIHAAPEKNGETDDNEVHPESRKAQDKNILHVGKDVFGIAKVQENLRIRNNGYLLGSESASSVFDIIVRRSDPAEDVSAESFLLEKRSSERLIRKDGEAQAANYTLLLNKSKDSLLHTEKRLRRFLRGKKTRRQTNPFSMPAALRNKNSQATMLLENTVNNRNAAKFKTDIYMMPREFNFQTDVRGRSENEATSAKQDEEAVASEALDENENDMQEADLVVDDETCSAKNEQELDATPDLIQLSERTKRLEERVKSMPQLVVHQSSVEKTSDSANEANSQSLDLQETDSKSVEAVEDEEKYNREPWGTNVANLTPGFLSRQMNLSPLPSGTIWNQEPRIRLAVALKKKQNGPKKYRYETKDLHSATGKTVRVTYLVEES